MSATLVFTFEDGSEALAHYGTKGMKWGVWNAETRAKYQGGDSSFKGVKKTVKDLNALDKRRAVEVGRHMDSSKSAERYKHKMDTARLRGNEKKASRMQAKYEKFSAEAKAHENAVKGIARHEEKLFKQAVKSGFDVKTRKIRRSTMTTGEKALQLAIAGAAMGVAGGAIIQDRTVPGVKYKVRNRAAVRK